MESKPTPPPETNKPTPVMDVVVAPPETPHSPFNQPGPSADRPKEADHQPTKPPKPPREPGNGVGMAIFATMVIVLSLAALATFAYLKTH